MNNKLYGRDCRISIILACGDCVRLEFFGTMLWSAKQEARLLVTELPVSLTIALFRRILVLHSLHRLILY